MLGYSTSGAEELTAELMGLAELEPRRIAAVDAGRGRLAAIELLDELAGVVWAATRISSRGGPG